MLSRYFILIVEYEILKTFISLDFANIYNPLKSWNSFCKLQEYNEFVFRHCLKIETLKST